MSFDSENDHRIYSEMLQAMAYCESYLRCWTGDIKVSEGPGFEERMVRYSEKVLQQNFPKLKQRAERFDSYRGGFMPEHTAYAIIFTGLWEIAGSLAHIDIEATNLDEMPDYFDDYFLTQYLFCRCNSAADAHALWKNALLRVSYAKNIPCDAITGKRIDVIMDMLYELSPYDDEQTYELISERAEGAVSMRPRDLNKLAAQTSTTNPKATGSGGCYVATAVYGSYDCPQVWTLRRYRDYDLASTWHGRLFIRVYYAASPAIVRRFGRSRWFNTFWRSMLDRMVSHLSNKGYESTPYEDLY